MKQKHRTTALLAACLLLASVVMIFGGCAFLQTGADDIDPILDPNTAEMISDKVLFSSDVKEVTIRVEFCFVNFNLDTEEDPALVLLLYDPRQMTEVLRLRQIDAIPKEDYDVYTEGGLPDTKIRVDISIPREYFRAKKGGEIYIGAGIGSNFTVNPSKHQNPHPFGLPYELRDDQIVLLKEYSTGTIGGPVANAYHYRYLRSIGLTPNDIIYN